LPMFHGMTDQDVEDVIAAVRKVTASYSRDMEPREQPESRSIRKS
jgi:hypothetical protein